MAIDIARLGIEVDPSGAEKGAEKAIRAAEDMGRKMPKSLNKVETGAKKASVSVDKGGEKIKKAAKSSRNALDKLGNNKGFDKLAKNARDGLGDARSSIIDALDVFGLMNGSIGRIVRQGDNLANIGKRISGAFSGLLTGGIVAGLAAIVVGVLAAVVAFKALKGAVKFTLAAMSEAGAMEQFTVRLAVLTGSMAKAREHVKRLNEFSDATPFTDSEVFDAGVKLEAMTKGVLSTNEALKAIGGSAFVAGKAFGDIADLTGGLFNSLKLGLDFIEPLKTMNKYGLITGETVVQVIKLGNEAKKSGDKTANFAAQWAAVYTDLQTNQQALELASGTWEGLLSTIGGKWQALQTTFGEPINDALKPALQSIIDLIVTLTPLAASIGQKLGDGLSGIVQIFTDGNVTALVFAALSDGMMLALRFLAVSFLLPVTIFADLLIGAVNLFSDALGLSLSNAPMSDFEAAMLDAVYEFELRLGDAMAGVAVSFINNLATLFTSWWNRTKNAISSFLLIDIPSPSKPAINETALAITKAKTDVAKAAVDASQAARALEDSVSGIGTVLEASLARGAAKISEEVANASIAAAKILIAAQGQIAFKPDPRPFVEFVPRGKDPRNLPTGRGPQDKAGAKKGTLTGDLLASQFNASFDDSQFLALLKTNADKFKEQNPESTIKKKEELRVVNDLNDGLTGLTDAANSAANNLNRAGISAGSLAAFNRNEISNKIKAGNRSSGGNSVFSQNIQGAAGLYGKTQTNNAFFKDNKEKTTAFTQAAFSQLSGSGSGSTGSGSVSNQDAGNIQDNLRGGGGGQQQQPAGITIINVTSQAEILQAMAENEDAILNIIGGYAQ